MPSRDAQWDALMKLAQAQARVLGPAFLALIQSLKGQLSVAQLTALLQSGGPDAVTAYLTQDPTIWRGLSDATHTALSEIAIAAAGDLPPLLVTAFDRYNPDAVSVMQREGARLIQYVSEGLRDGIRAQVSNGIAEGLNPREVAIAVRDGLGLTATQATHVFNYRTQLETLKSGALDRALRDARSDPRILRALANKQPLDPAYIDKLVEGYQRRYIAYRAETIARTEALQSLHTGQRLAWMQVFADGKARRSDVRRFWFVGKDERTCPVCRPIPGMNRDGVGFDEPFQTPKGPVEGPTMHPDCRCVVFTQPS